MRPAAPTKAKPAPRKPARTKAGTARVQRAGAARSSSRPRPVELVRTKARSVRAPRTRVRLLGLLVAMAVAFGAIALRLVDLQAVSASHYTELGLAQRVQTVALPALRGSVFDRDGNVLATSAPVRTIVADPRVIADPAGYAERLAPIVHVDERDLRERLAQHDAAFAYVARQVDDEVAKKVLALKLAGISAIPESKRFYPSGTLAAPVLGTTDVDGNGLAGLESANNAALAGKAGYVALERDPQGRDIPDGKRRGAKAVTGTDLVLTLDQSMQDEVEQALTEEVDRVGAQGGTAAVVDVHTGDILAMATVDGPRTLDDGTVTHAHPAKRSERNRALTDVFEPGSTNKVVTLATALEAGTVTPDTTFEVPFSMQVGDKTFEDAHEHDTETMSVADILRESSNIGAIKIGDTVGKWKLDKMMRAFGYGKKTPVDFPGEAAGILPDEQTYRSDSTITATVPMGQGIAVTALQMLDVYTTLANDGVSRPPRLVAATIGADGQRVEHPADKGRRVVSSRTAEQLRTMLAAVVADGTGTKAAVPGYSVAGKTGTAKKAPYADGKYVASFVGFAPVESPRFATIVVVDAPGSGDVYGGDVAAPVFSQIMQYALRTAQVPPTQPVDGASEAG